MKSRKKKQVTYVIIIEKEKKGYGAYVPDLPGCVAAAKTEKQVVKLIKEAIKFHISGIKEEGAKLPIPQSRVEYFKLAA